MHPEIYIKDNIVHVIMIYIVTDVQSQATGSGPLNTVVQSSTELVLGCHFPDSDDVDWYRNDTRISHNGRLLGPVNPGSHRIVGNKVDKEYNLNIFSVDPSRDVALYGCRFNVPSVTKVYWYKAHVIVIGLHCYR